jgi:chromosome segregation ATPase
MQLPKRSAKLEWNLNTLIQLATLGGMIVGGVVIWVDKSRDIDDIQGWVARHEQYHKERMADLKAGEASVNERLRAVDQKTNDADRKIDNLTYRITVAEQSAATITSSIKELQELVNKQAGDLQVVREILQRMEAQQRTVR